MVRKRKRPNNNRQNLPEAQVGYPSLVANLAEVFQFFSEGALMMACGIVVGLALGQTTENGESKTTLAYASGALFTFGIVFRLIVCFLEVWNVRHK